MQPCFWPSVLRLVCTALACAGLSACSDALPSRPATPFAAPVQAGLVRHVPAIEIMEGVWAVPRASYSLEGFVVAARKPDRAAAQVGVMSDWVLAWSVVAEPQNAPRVNITQTAGHHEWRIDDANFLQQIGPRAVDLSMASTRVIPASPDVRSELEKVRVGLAVQARGYLVDLRTRESTSMWRTSLTRADKGAGSAEVFYVQEARVMRPEP